MDNQFNLNDTITEKSMSLLYHYAGTIDLLIQHAKDIHQAYYDEDQMKIDQAVDSIANLNIDQNKCNDLAFIKDLYNRLHTNKELQNTVLNKLKGN